jgi:hypothetical protein
MFNQNLDLGTKLKAQEGPDQFFISPSPTVYNDQIQGIPIKLILETTIDTLRAQAEK